jgi:hypothetical protein
VPHTRGYDGSRLREPLRPRDLDLVSNLGPLGSMHNNRMLRALLNCKYLITVRCNTVQICWSAYVRFRNTSQPHVPLVHVS